jgi:hypothetical protein
MTEEAALLAHYMPLVVKAPSTAPEDRKFAASIIAQTRKGRAPSDRQVWRMRRMVERFKDRELRGEE